MPRLFSSLPHPLSGSSVGDVVYVSALGQSIVILNSAQAISDLLEHRGAVYSDRVKMVMAGEL